MSYVVTSRRRKLIGPADDFFGGVVRMVVTRPRIWCRTCSCGPGGSGPGSRGRSTFRAWLYRIATNACLDVLRRTARRHVAAGQPSISDLPWLDPYPDRLLAEIAPRAAEPDATAVAKETIELTFLAAIQLLPP